MATGVQNAFSTTAAANSTADSQINWREGMSPSAVNDSARALMALIKKWCKDWQGGLVTAGTSTAYTLTTNEGLTLADGVKVKCRMSVTNGAAPTLNVDGTGAVAIQSVQGTVIAAGVLPASSIHEFTYYAASAAWIVAGTIDATQSISAATTSLAGKVELATDAEAIAKADTGRVITPSNLAALGSSETFAGLVELADTTEASAGTDTARAVTAAGLAAHVNARAVDQTTQETGTSTSLFVTPGKQHFHPGHPKNWVNFNGTGTIAIRSDYGVSSLTDNGTGDYAVNFDTAFSSTESYCVAGMSYDASDANTVILLFGATPLASTAISRLRTGNPAQGTFSDLAFVFAACFGDQ